MKDFEILEYFLAFSKHSQGILCHSRSVAGAHLENAGFRLLTFSCELAYVTIREVNIFSLMADFLVKDLMTVLHRLYVGGLGSQV